MSNEQPAGTPRNPDPATSFPQPGAYAPPAQPGQAQPGYGPSGQPHPGYAPQQPPQPYQAYGQPGYPQQQPTQPQNPYQIPNYSAQYGSQQPAYPAQQYPQQYAGQQYPAQAGYIPGQKAAKSPMLGMIAFAVLALCVVVGSLAGFQVMQLAAGVIASSGMTDANQTEVAEMLQQQLMSSYPLQTIALNITGWAGFAAWVAGIVATATNRGRMWGVLTIILGVLTPVIIIVVAFAAMGPALEALR